jgi:NitT/TauT family transport system substrate-binding protein
MKHIILGTSLAFAMLFSCLSANAEPLRLAHSSWVGYGPLYIAQEKGYFRDEGVDVQLSLIESSADSMAAMAAGRLDAVASTVDNFALFAGNGAQVKVVLAFDESYGGDGLIAKKEITSPAMLKGKTVAAQKASVSQFFLAQILRDAGLTLNDVNLIDMKAGDAGAAFVAGSVDAAVTWEPWLSRARATSFGVVLVDSKAKSGLIIDALGARADYVAGHTKEIQALTNAYFKAAAFAKEQPEAAAQIMAKGLKMPVDAFAGAIKDVRIMGKEENAAFFRGGPDSNAMKLARAAGEFYRGIGVLRREPDVSAVVDATFTTH